MSLERDVKLYYTTKQGVNHVIAHDFLYQDKYLSDFGMIMADTGSGAASGLGREILKGSTTAYRSEAVHYGTAYSGALTLDFFIVKDPYKNGGARISPPELRNLQAWLTGARLPQPLYLCSREHEPIAYDGIFTEITPFVFAGLNGLNVTFTCRSPFAYRQNELRCTVSDRETPVRKSIFCDTDEWHEMIYPTITFAPNSAGKISVTNQSDPAELHTMELSPPSCETFVIDCGLKRLLADGNVISFEDVNWNKEQLLDIHNVDTGLFRMYWLRLLPGKNLLDFSGDGAFTIQYKTRLKLGGLNDV